MRKGPVIIEHGEHIQQLLEYYMGKNTQERQEFIIDNLKVESRSGRRDGGNKGLKEKGDNNQKHLQ